MSVTSSSHQQNPLFSKLISLDLNTNDDDDQTTTAPLVELFLCLIQEEKNNNDDASSMLYLHIGLLLLWRSLLTVHHARGGKYFDAFPFEVSLFELVSPVNNADQKRKTMIEELINNMLNSLFHSPFSDRYDKNNVMMDISSSDEQIMTEIGKLLAFIHGQFNKLQKVNIAINAAVVSRFRTEMCLFVLTSSSSSFVSPVQIDEFILEDDVLTTLLSTTSQNTNNNNQEQEDDENFKRLHFYKNLIIAGVTHAVRLGLLNGDNDTKLLCDMLLQLQSSTSSNRFNDNNNNLCHHRSWLLEVFQEKKREYNADGTFLQDFIIDGVLKKQVADNRNDETVHSAAVSPLLPLVSLFVANLKNDDNNNNSDVQNSSSSVIDILLRFAQNNRKNNNKRIDGEIALCLLHLSFVTNNAENENASTSFMIEILSLLLDHDGLNFDSSFWSRAFLIAIRSLSIDDENDSSVIMMLMKELYRQREHYLPPSSSSSSLTTTSRYAIECMFETINDAIDLVQSLDNDESSDSDRDEEDSIQDKNKTCLSINIRDLITTIIYASSSSPTLAQRTLIVGTFLRHAILQQKEEGETAHHDRRTKSFFFDLVKVFCSHIMMFASLSEEESDENTVASSVSSMSNGLCAVLLLEGYGEPMYEKESDDASRIFDYSFCRTLSKYLKKYLPEFVSLSDGVELLLLDDEQQQQQQGAKSSFVSDLKEIITQFETEEQDGEDVKQQDDCYNILENDQTNSSDDIIKSRVSSSIRSLLKLGDNVDQNIIKRDPHQTSSRDNNNSHDEIPTTTTNTTTSLATRMALISLQKSESQERREIEMSSFSSSSSFQQDFFQLWTSAALQLHIEFFRDEIWTTRFLQNTSRQMIEELWFATAVDLKLNNIDKIQLVEIDEPSERRASVLEIEDAFAAEILFPLVQSRLELLVEEASERHPLSSTATSYSSLSWLFEEEKVVRNEIVIADEEEERAAVLETAFEQLVFCRECFDEHKRRFGQEVLAQHETIFLHLVKSVYENVIEPENKTRDTLSDLFFLERNELEAREEIESEFFDVFLHDLIVVKRKQELFINRVYEHHAAECFSQYLIDFHEMVLESLVDVEWEEGVEKIYEMREEEGAELIDVQREYEKSQKQNQQHRQNRNIDKTMANKMTVEGKNREKEQQQQQQQQQQTSSSHMKTVPISLPAHVAKSLIRSEKTMRREIVTEREDAHERLLFWLWMKLQQEQE